MQLTEEQYKEAIKASKKKQRVRTIKVVKTGAKIGILVLAAKGLLDIL